MGGFEMKTDAQLKKDVIEELRWEEIEPLILEVRAAVEAKGANQGVPSE